MDNVWVVITMLGGVSVLVPGICVFISQLLTQKLIYKLQNQNNKEIESLRAVFSQNSALISVVSSNHSASYQKLLGQRIEAINIYWKNIRLAKSEFPAVVSVLYDILIDTEFNINGIGKGKNSLGKGLSEVSLEKLATKLEYYSDLIDDVRPFISSKLWQLKYVYIFLIGRLTHVLVDGYNESNVILWKDDSGVKQMLPYALTQKEIDHSFSLKIGGVKYIFETIELRMIEEINAFISNENFANESIDQIKKLNVITQSMGKDKL